MKVINEDSIRKSHKNGRTNYKGYIIREMDDCGYDIIDPKFDPNEPIYDYVSTLEEAMSWIDYTENATAEEVGNQTEEENVPDAPQGIEDNGIAGIINKLIIDEWEAIDGYNSAIMALNDLGRYDEAKVLSDIANEENIHVGQLQKIMETVSPNAASIKDGEVEAQEQLVQEPAENQTASFEDEMQLTIPEDSVDDTL